MITITEGKKYDIREYSQWGIVVDNNDPLKLQRLRIRLDSYPKNMKDEQIPWASPLKSVFQGGGSGVFGTISVPEVNTIVRVVHLYDQYSPCYIDEIQSSLPMNLIVENLTDYPRIYGAQDSNKNYYRVELVKKLMKILMDSEIQINQTGDVKIKMNGNINLKCDNLVVESDSIQVTCGKFDTNSELTARKIETSVLNTDNLSASSANVNGAFSGTLDGTAYFATYAGQQPSPQITPNIAEIDLPVPIKPDLDFDTK